MWQRVKGRTVSHSGFSNQQALLAILIAFPLGLISIGIILNLLIKPSAEQASKSTETKQTQSEDSAILNPPSSKSHSVETTSDKSILDMGASLNGEPIRLLVNSILKGEKDTHTFTYQLGDTRIDAIANCSDGSWITYPERQLNRPQSPATEQMIMRVCDNSAGHALPDVALVHDPPSNVRATPGGDFQCSIDSKRTIRVGQLNGDWYSTTVCGREGFIHRSQLKF